MSELNHTLVPGKEVLLTIALKGDLYGPDLAKVPKGAAVLRYVFPERDKRGMLWAIAFEVKHTTSVSDVKKDAPGDIVHIIYPEKAPQTGKLRLRYGTMSKKTWTRAFLVPKRTR